MKRFAFVALAALALGTGPIACKPARPAETPGTHAAALTTAYLRAAESEQLAVADEAVQAQLELVDQGLAAGPEGLGAVTAALDALVWRDTMGLSRIASAHALAFRAPGALATVETALGKAWDRKAGHPLARALVALALTDLARFRGDADRAATYRARAGVVARASAAGPLAWGPLSSIEKPCPMEDGPLKDAYPGFGPFAVTTPLRALEADDGNLDVASLGITAGLYAAAVDVDAPRAQRAYVMLRSSSAAQVVASGKVVVTRPYALGGGTTLRMGAVDLPAGRTRLVARVGVNDDGGRIGIYVVGDDGAPLATIAPKPGEAAAGVVTDASPLELAPVTGDRPEVAAAALLCLGEARGARRLLEGTALRDDAGPVTQLLFARAIGRSDDVPETRRIERARSAYGRAQKAWPGSWEAIVGSAIHAAARKGAGEGRVETLRDLSRSRETGAKTDPIVRAFEGATAMEVGMRDVALLAFDEIKGALAGTPLLVELDEKVHPRVGAEAEAFACATPLYDRQSLACFGQKQRRGDSAGALTELTRIRALRGAPSAFLGLELAQRASDGDVAGSLAIYDRMLPGERSLALLGIVPAKDPSAALSRLARDARVARDTPGPIAPLLRLFGPDPVPAMEAEGLAAVKAGRDGKGDATVVLHHTERYEIGDDGILRLLVHDVRRVSGTTDVEQGIGGTFFNIVGRDVRRTLRRKIHKKDGRTLEPDRAANASQGNADLSQLEPGDAVEQILEGVALPDRTGNLVVDGPDLLPERTGVKRAVIELVTPKSVSLARWSHPLLGKPKETSSPTGQRVLRWELSDASPRRLEEGVPRMDRDVTISFGTYTWKDVGKHLGEQVRALGDRDPMVAKWARDAAGEGATPSRATVEKIVTAAGKTVRVANGSMLTDMASALQSGGQTLTARQIVELGQGSRTWLVYRALREVGVDAEIAVAEKEPFSADPAYPARPARFDHPLVLAHVDGGDVWVDADVNGPPLPAGRVSPELRGRSALRATGDIVTLPSTADGARDEVDIRLKVDARGDASGTFTVVLRGRQAQGLAEAFETVVGTDRREMLRRVVLGWLPWANVNDVVLSSTEGSWEVSLRAEVSIPSFAQSEGKVWVVPGLEPLHSVFPRPSVSTVGATFASRAGRQSALAVDMAFQYHVRRRIELPPGTAAPAVLPSVNVKHELLEATRSVKMQDGAIEEDYALSIATGTVGPEAYDKFAAAARKVDDGFLSGLRIAR